MIIVTNTIKVEKGYAAHVIKQFAGHAGDGAPTRQIADVDGFLGFELWQTHLPEADYEEVVVTSKWVSEAAQKAWVKSDSFKQAHGRTKDSRDQQRDRKGILSSTITQYEVVHMQAPAEKGDILHENTH
ncbi:heme oxygenase IsdG [Listeria costaricensis]|uniref:heme oxygenase IsdG n=1 Tax=Listeria costaricensis TaxID=2026604 RepID=UPI000C077047|nr:heme oxygenase IsdG [Listeria costaricensis]